MIPYIHAEMSAKRYGGTPEDYIDIHELMDSSKACVSDNRHRFLTHNSWFVVNIIPKIFGHQRVNSDGKKYNTKDVCEYHILEDFRMKFLPTPQDYAEHMEIQPWMNNAMGLPNRLKNKKPPIPNTFQSQDPDITPPVNLEETEKLINPDTTWTREIMDGNWGMNETKVLD